MSPRPEFSRRATTFAIKGEYRHDRLGQRRARWAKTDENIAYLRTTMGKAVEDFTPFEEAYAKTDWSRFARVPAFDAANRINAYGQYLVMERELLKGK